VPEPEELSTQYRYLLDWYRDEYCAKGGGSIENDPILRLRGAGKEIWKGIDPDEYVRQLREGWE
jgi:hypothetical protein